MVPSAPEPVERRRPYVGAPFALSDLTVTVDPPAGPGDDALVLGLLRRARSAGITTFDIAEAADPIAARSLLARAFPHDDPELVVLVPGRSSLAEHPRNGPPSFTAPGAAGPVRADRPREPPALRFRELTEVAAAELTRAAGEPGRADGAPAPVVVRCRTAEDVELAARQPPPRLLSGGLSLLDRSLVDAAERTVGAGRFSWIARDPFAGGRLDGSRFSARSSLVQGAAPPSLRALEAEFGPVARLAFLVRSRERTLAQAALRYALAREGVVSVCLPPIAPERWSEIVGYRASPPLAPEELARVDATASGGPAGTGGRTSPR